MLFIILLANIIKAKEKMFLESQNYDLKQKGSIEVICGSMFSGKTEELIRRIIRAKIARQKVAIFKPKLDNRYSNDNIVDEPRR